MILWRTDPSPQLEAAFNEIHQTRMAGLPILNPALTVEAVGFRKAPDGHWIGALITPWSLNLLRLPGQAENWPADPAGSKFDWRFPSGNYEFTVADGEALGPYHLCSLFSPAFEFSNHAQAKLTASAIVDALFQGTVAPAAPAPDPAPDQPSRSRRAFLGLGR